MEPCGCPATSFPSTPLERCRWRRSTGAGGRVRPVRAEGAAARLSRELAAGSSWLTPSSVGSLMRCYGLPLIETRIVHDSDEAVAVAGGLRPPLALKANAAGPGRTTHP